MADIAASLGRMWRPALEYSNAFANVRFGIMAPDKRLRIIKEFAKLWQNQVFEYIRLYAKNFSSVMDSAAPKRSRSKSSELDNMIYLIE